MTMNMHNGQSQRGAVPDGAVTDSAANGGAANGGAANGGAATDSAATGGATFTCVETPIGTLTLAGGDAGLRMVWFGAHTPRWAAPAGPALHPVLASAADQLDEYFAGTRTVFDLPLDVRGPHFQRQAWFALATIPYGSTVSYGEQARRIGYPGAARAVGAANARNPLPVILPCHRVIGANGSLTGFGGGLGTKRWLLEHEMLVSSRDRATPDAGALF